ncbi:MAG: NYN domain-containing protein [Acidimicrobiia bacterium]
MSDPVVPPLPEALLSPLLDTAGEVLRALDAEAVPVSLRQLHGFHARGMARGTARMQLRTAMETDDAFRKRVVDEFLDQPEVAAALEGWGVAVASERIDDAAARSDLPLLASALVAARPSGWLYGLGLASATFERSRRVHEADDALQALEQRLEQADEARRRAEAAKTLADEHASQLERELREERGAKRQREDRSQRSVDAAQRQVQDALVEGERLQRVAEEAKKREQRTAEKLRTVEAELRALREEASGPEVKLRDRDLQALVDAAELAGRLAKGLGGVADRVQTLRSPQSNRSSRAAGQAGSRRDRRARLRIPPGLSLDAPDAVELMLRTPGAVLIVDGYNVTKRAWPVVTLSEQRDRLVGAVTGLHARTHCDATIVFDGADVGPAPAQRRPGVRVRFSAANEEADAVVVREVAALPPTVPVLVVSSDREVQVLSQDEGATVVSADTFLRALRS